MKTIAYIILAILIISFNYLLSLVGLQNIIPVISVAVLICWKPFLKK